jgi:serine/threonine protein phosphatase PrpC
MSHLQQLSAVLPISVGAVSETGHREQNQDCMTGFASPFGAAYLIADGMGGHRGGAEASRMVVEAFTRHFLATPASSPLRDAVTLAVRLANLEVLEKGKSGNPDFAGMGSTFVMALVRQTDQGMELMTAHVGDSRIYWHRNGNLTLLTKDHTHVQWLIDSHALDEALARNHPDASILTRAMGHTTDLQVDISDPIPLCEGDGILLCSDGLSGYASTEDIHRTIEQNPDPTVCASELVQLALASGSDDNITVQFLRIGRLAQPAMLQGTGAAEGVDSIPASSKRTRKSAKKRLGLLLLAAVLIVLLAGAWFWRYYVHRVANRAEDAAVSKQMDLARTGKDSAAQIHDRAVADIGTIGQTLAKQPATHNGQQGDRSKKLSDLSRELETVAGESNSLAGEFDKYIGSLTRIEKEMPAQQRKQDLELMARKISLSANRLDMRKHRLGMLENREADLEKIAPEVQDRVTPSKGAHRQPPPPATKTQALGVTNSVPPQSDAVP